MIQRSTIALISEVIDSYHKMAFVGGPRQVGKTTVAKLYQKNFSQSLYVNWDNILDQKKILSDPYFFTKVNRDPKKPFLVVFDEIHKYARWKNYLKGTYDQYQEEFRFLITGSGRLEFFKKGGDSLLGRYFSVPLFPLSLGELNGKMSSLQQFKESLTDPPSTSRENSLHFQNLLKFSGFPEPFSKATESFYNRWFAERKTLLVRQDIRDASAIREISLLEHLAHLLPARVGSPLSTNRLKEDVGTAYETIREWLLLLEQFFYIFRVTPFTGNLARTFRKESKVYLYDWAEVEEEGYRFENFVALHLLKAVGTWKALGEPETQLNFIRDKEKREVDFALSEKGKLFCLIECKTSDETLSPHLLYYQQKFKVPVAVQLLHKPNVCKKIRTGDFTQWVISADRWLGSLP